MNEIIKKFNAQIDRDDEKTFIDTQTPNDDDVRKEIRRRIFLRFGILQNLEDLLRSLQNNSTK